MMNKKNKIRSSPGATLLEMVVAVAMSAMVIRMIFATYADFTRGFFHQINKAAQVQRMLLVKKQIDRVFDDINVVVSQRQKGLEFLPLHSETLRTFRCDSTTASLDSIIVAKGLSGFACSLLREPGDTVHAVLSWEARIENGWIGGAKQVVMQH